MILNSHDYSFHNHFTNKNNLNEKITVYSNYKYAYFGFWAVENKQDCNDS